MKTIITKSAVIFLLMAGINLTGQTSSTKETISVLNIDSRGIDITPSALGSLVRIELEKLNLFSVKDRYDIQQYFDDNHISMNNCYGKTCLTEIGIKLESDKMLTGTFEKIARSIVVSLKLLDVKTSVFQQVYVHEFLYIPEELPNMVKLSVAEMFGQPYDKNVMNKLTHKFEFDNSYNNPDIDRLRLDGPRMGFVSFTGHNLNQITAPVKDGGFDKFPIMFQFGYQFERQYLNEGKIQALFEFIPMITGLDQGLFIPSVTLLHGVRSNINGFEFAFGPSINIVRMAKGYYDQDGNWQLESKWYQDGNIEKNPHEVVTRMDSRGFPRIQSSFVLAVGRTFKSGRLNIPVNCFVIPGANGWRYGISFGFNAKNRK